jgi:hypothetical protein
MAADATPGSKQCGAQRSKAPRGSVALAAAPLAPDLQEALQRHFGAQIGFLQLHAPIAQILDRDLLPRDGTANEIAIRENLKFPVQISQLGLARLAYMSLKSIHSHHYALTFSPEPTPAD